MTAEVLVLRTCDAKMQSRGGFVWPRRGPVSAPDWDPSPTCGGGLHGLLWGEGVGARLSWAPDARWLVVAVEADQIVDLTGKVKFPRGLVRHCGTRETATVYLAERVPPGVSIVGGNATAGDYGTATAGDRGAATAGDYGTIEVAYWDGQRRRRVVGYVGEDGIMPGIEYRLNRQHEWVEVREVADE